MKFDGTLITPSTTRPNGKTDEPRVGLRIKFLSEVVAKPQKYLWDPYIPSDQLIALYGPSHTAKSIIALDWAARITTGAMWPDKSPGTAPRKVLMLSAGEDATETVLKPRFVLAGGDPSRLHFVDVVKRFSSDGDIFEDMAALDQDIPEISAALEKDKNYAMVIVDPVTNHLGKKRTNVEEEVRPVLMKLRGIAEKHNVPVVIIGHLNKRPNGTAALERMLGCAAFSGVPRTIYLTGPDNDTTERFRFVLAQERGLGSKAWKYKTQIAETVVDGSTVKQVLLSWEGNTDAVGQDVVDTLSREEKRTENDLADQLRAYLVANGGTASQEDCKRALDFPKVNWTRLRAKAKVDSTPQRGGTGGGCAALWSLTSDSTTATVSVCKSDSTHTNIMDNTHIFSTTYAIVQSDSTSDSTNTTHGVLSPPGKNRGSECPQCGRFKLAPGLCLECQQK
jgi:hypothetical protein